jgi:FixJ family two-component response regulator
VGVEGWGRQVMVKRKQIIVLDDDATFRDAIKRVLDAHGFNVDVFGTVEGLLGDACLGYASCLVLDIHLNGTSGIDLRRQLARSGLSLPVIFMTGDEDEATRKAALEAGCVAYLLKPFPPSLLIGAIERTLGQSMAAS